MYSATCRQAAMEELAALRTKAQQEVDYEVLDKRPFIANQARYLNR